MGDRPQGLTLQAWFVTKAIRPVARFLAWSNVVDVAVTGRDVVPKRGAVIIASNHISLADSVFLWGALRRRAMGLAMAELWQMRGVRQLVRASGQIPVKRRDPESGRRAIEAAQAVLRHGGVLVIYPEGRCVRPGETEPYKPGVAKLSFESGVPIIPVGTTGTNKFLPLKEDNSGRKAFYRHEPVRLTFGEPLDPKDYADQEALLVALREAIEDLVAFTSADADRDVAVRAARIADAAGIAACDEACWREGFGRGLPPEVLRARTDPFSAQQWERELREGAGMLHVAIWRDEVIGFAVAGRPGGGTVELDALHVRERWHGRRVGGRLLDELFGGAPAQVWVLAANLRAQQFYASCGFTATCPAVERPGLGALAVRMERGRPSLHDKQ